MKIKGVSVALLFVATGTILSREPFGDFFAREFDHMEKEAKRLDEEINTLFKNTANSLSIKSKRSDQNLENIEIDHKIQGKNLIVTVKAKGIDADKVNVTVEPDKNLLKAIIPSSGSKINLQIYKNVISYSTQKEVQEEEKKDKQEFYYASYGSSSSSQTISATIEPDKSEVEYQDGYLIFTIPIKDKVKKLSITKK